MMLVGGYEAYARTVHEEECKNIPKLGYLSIASHHAHTHHQEQLILTSPLNGMFLGGGRK